MPLYNQMRNIRQRSFINDPVSMPQAADTNTSDVNNVSSQIAQQLYTNPIRSTPSPSSGPFIPVSNQIPPETTPDTRVKQPVVVRPSLSNQQAASNNIFKRYMMQRY